MNSSRAALDMLPCMEAAVIKAASYMVRTIENPEQVAAWRKDDQTVVTTLDIESQHLIKESLGSHLPVVSEEDQASHALLSSSSTLFVVDPLDGTSSCRRFMNSRGGHLGFGPLIGFVDEGKLRAACFYHLPERALFSALSGGGCFMAELDVHSSEACVPLLSERRRLQVSDSRTLQHSALLFYPGSEGELKFVEYVRAATPIENTYRFGGFANDCTRLARGLEQAQVQFAVRAWDFPAVLFSVEAGLQAVVNPMDSCTPFDAWNIRDKNPVLVGCPRIFNELLGAFKAMRSKT